MQGRQQVEGDAGAVRFHGIVEAAERRFPRVVLVSDPVDRQTDTQAPEHPQIPSGVAGAHATLVFQGAHIEPLMQAILDAPVAPLVVEPSPGIVALRAMARDEEELLEGGLGFGRIVNCLLQQRPLLG